MLGLIPLAALGAASGCGLRWERGAPQLPIVPSARAYPGAAALRTELAASRSAHAAAQAWSVAGGPVLSRVLLRVHGEQIAALIARLESVSEPVPPAESGTAATSPSGSPTASPSGRSEDDARARLLEAEAAGLREVDALAAAPAADRALLAGCLVTRAQAARLLGAGALQAPRRPAAGSVEQAVDLLATVRPVVYGLEVATARVVVAGGERAQVARASLDAARRQRQFLEQQAGNTAPAAPLGYVLDDPVDTPADAAKLAHRLLTDLADAHVRAVAAAPPTSADTPGAAPQVVASLLSWAREAEWWRGQWGAGPRALGVA
ncbi:hypothetical protein KILIM_010_00540 [Kineosphaera limosa NBRC 100340]|uniref:DUF4439 domain-containing protein n=1 Tax=Kineosphaera limosa NBRC 100340 TaxID=1184609 RepID=K6VEV5_9MICO|nr:hypothetical protein KILIM_010_00540 [Kineosphaera limosa NBRC 100340]